MNFNGFQKFKIFASFFVSRKFKIYSTVKFKNQKVVKNPFPQSRTGNLKITKENMIQSK